MRYRLEVARVDGLAIVPSDFKRLYAHFGIASDVEGGEAGRKMMVEVKERRQAKRAEGIFF